MVKYLLCILTIFSLSMSFAQDKVKRKNKKNKRIARFFKLNDLDRDGKITAEELDDSTAFGLLDRNGDGVITRSELSGKENSGQKPPKNKITRPAKLPETKMMKPVDRENFRKRLDIDQNGSISQDEWKGPERIFRHLDKNKDGVLDANEIPKPSQMGQMQRRKKFLRRLKRMDQNQDGQISKDEWEGKGPMFKHLDKNNDGILTKDELPKNPGKKGKKGKRGKNLAKRLKKMDKDQDGQISSEEWQGNEKMFGKLDRNGDGFISKNELPKGRNKKGMQQRLKQLDKDQDGQISSEEWPANKAIFKRLDRNGDGFLSKNELPKKFGKGKGKGNMRKRLKKMDRDQDGQISREEWRGNKEKFDKMDQDQDGSLTEEEIKQAMQKGKNKMRKKVKDKMKKRLKKMDEDQDGQISSEEWQGSEKKFNKMDQDQDGFLTEEELKQA